MQGDSTAALAAAHRIWARLEDGMNLIAAAAIFFLMFVGVFQIIGRTAFNAAIYGYIDYMEQASALFAFLGISYAQRVRAHIRMDLLLRGFSMRFLWSMGLFAVHGLHRCWLAMPDRHAARPILHPQVGPRNVY